eukprot:UN03068
MIISNNLQNQVRTALGNESDPYINITSSTNNNTTQPISQYILLPVFENNKLSSQRSKNIRTEVNNYLTKHEYD